MDWLMWIVMIPVAWFLWWVGFVSTKRMRIEKNKERTVGWEKMAAAQKLAKQQAEDLSVKAQSQISKDAEQPEKS